MNFSRLTFVVVVLLALVIVGFTPAFAQTTIATGSITGTVTDAQVQP